MALTRSDARAFLHHHTGLPLDTTAEEAAAYRAAAFKLHPDRGGSAEEFKRLQQAKDALGL